MAESKSGVLQGTLDLEAETENWERIAATMARFLAASRQG
jgi:hypothetical protein